MIRCLKLLVLLFFFSYTTYAQDKIEKYCEVVCAEKGFSGNNSNVFVSTGKMDSLFSFKDTTIVTDVNKVKKLKTRIDVLNYMSSLNWTLVFTTQVSGSHTFIFKRVFNKSEILTQ